jgi:hypothetical protein
LSAELALTYWPQLRSAVQPAPIPRLQRFNGAFCVADEWAQLVQRVERGEYRLRSPAASFRGLCGPFHSIGHCLAPLKLPGDFEWLDPEAVPQDGDLVVIAWGEETVRRITERVARDVDLLSTYGSEPVTLGTKLLRKFGSAYMLVCRDSVIPLRDNRVLGVVRYIERGGVPIYGCGIVAHQIGPDSVGSMFAGSDDGPEVAYCDSGTGNNAGSIDLVTFTPVSDGTVQITGELLCEAVTAAISNGSTPLVWFVARQGGVDLVGALYERRMPVTTTPQLVTYSTGSFDVVGGSAVTIRLRWKANYSGGGGDMSATLSDIAAQAWLKYR